MPLEREEGLHVVPVQQLPHFGLRLLLGIRATMPHLLRVRGARGSGHLPSPGPVGLLGERCGGSPSVADLGRHLVVVVAHLPNTSHATVRNAGTS